jgi:hypothetical protein
MQGIRIDCHVYALGQACRRTGYMVGKQAESKDKRKLTESKHKANKQKAIRKQTESKQTGSKQKAIRKQTESKQEASRKQTASKQQTNRKQTNRKQTESSRLNIISVSASVSSARSMRIVATHQHLFICQGSGEIWPTSG